jgi:curved DNA-binding protein
MAEDHYKTLGLTFDASPEDIKKAFRKIARQCHPDVAQSDEGKIARFMKAKRAYEVLSDVKARSRYDRRHERRTESGTFFEAFYKQTGKGFSGGRTRVNRPGRKGVDPANNLDLEDLFNETSDFGFGGEAQSGRIRSGARKSSPRSRAAPQPGEDVHIGLSVGPTVCKAGGTVTAVYYRLQRADSWRPGAPDAGLVRVQDIADIRLLPGTVEGEVLRERGLGDAGAHGGPYGDLLVQLNFLKETPPPPVSESAVPDDTTKLLDISVVEAILGGRIQIETPQGRVLLSVPPGTSSGAKLRLKRRGRADDAGNPTDLYVRVRVVVPRDLDDESRALIEQFATLNPGSPRE